MIIKKDISWLLERVPDFKEFMDSHAIFFNNGGYLSGGFLRDCLLTKSAQKAKANLVKRNGDIDFFFQDQDACEKTAELLRVTNGFMMPRVFNMPKVGKNTRINKKNKIVPNSSSGWAFEFMSAEYVKYQLIYKNIGTPEEVLNRFDIANCKLAVDNANFWIEEEWESLEEKKLIRVDNYAGLYLLTRLAKYLTSEYDVFPEAKDELLIKMLEKCNKELTGGNMYAAAAAYAVRRLLAHKTLVPRDMIIMFYDKLGTAQNAKESISPDMYDSLMAKAPVDFAMHMYNHRDE